jgi:hypothetical protein
MNRILEINTTANYAVVEGGVTWLVLLTELDKYGFTLVSCQSGLTFSVAGSFCGNAHGKKTRVPMIKDAVLEFEFIDGRGMKHVVCPEDPIFHAFPGSLGLLGFITRMKIKIEKRYATTVNVLTVHLTNTSIQEINRLTKMENICMLNFRCSYFTEKIPEIVLLIYFCGSSLCSPYPNYFLEKMEVSSFHEQMKIYYTLIVILLWFLANGLGEPFDETRWNAEKADLLKLNEKEPRCMNVNNTFEIWTKIYVPGFRIIEFFFPIEHFMYSQQVIMRIFHENNMRVLSSGSRILFEESLEGSHFGMGFLRFSKYASKNHPYISLTVNFIEDIRNMENLTNEIRRHIFAKNIKMTYHTTYHWNFSKEDILFMFSSGIEEFRKIKESVDPEGIFTNKFAEMYLSPSPRIYLGEKTK